MTNINEKHYAAKLLFLEQLSTLLQEMEWGRDLLHMAEKKCDFIHNYHYILFPNGYTQIAEEFETWQGQKMLETLSTEEVPTQIRAKIARALEIRIMQIVPRSVLLKQNALFLLPSNILAGIKSNFNTCDLIWRYAGDKSDDFNYYTKRGLLLGVYISSRLFYLADQSHEFIKTKEFIATSLDNIINIATIKNKIKIPKMEDIPILRLFS